MQSYKRNQVEEAVAAALNQSGAAAGADLRIRLKRLLETDRALARESAAGSLRPLYAFYTGEAPGRGGEVWFSPYEAFALLMGVVLMEHHWPQGTAVRILRQARPVLEPEHARILAQDPERLLDAAEVKRRAAPGKMAVASTDPVVLAIVTAQGSRTDPDAAPDAQRVCRGEKDLMRFWRQQAPLGSSMTVLELTARAHGLAACLARTSPKTRGRASR
jgi:hypothetical protein